ncbi:amidohydrolase [Kaistia dalseonensis]|uniref:TIM-barrel fold metal-dependent hydrolase n=1 Tax=Kaistia dalseonensis TaxID=410840 RepID=A0ABU0H8D1_9HYPH|nr:amidohydrolase [Kaistia dalseonensis]MCX5495960.1 amidohydrolase [Kaistia dalseonensis]MDQ0438563.1 putative TIM-barrel fold metal-dependent hydrolase [Kaistia dalseonensis]
MRIIDTHLHLVYQERLRYPWLAGAPALNRNFTLDDYLPQAEALGISAMLHMEVDVAEEDMEVETAFVTGLGRGVVGAIAACRPESPDFPALLERYAQNPKVKGLRRILHQSPDELGQRPIFTENLKRLAAYPISFDFCVLPHQIPIAIAIAKAAPDVQFIIDHCGVPNVKDEAFEPWRTNMSAIAELPNVAAKISGVIAYGDPVNWTVDDLRPFVEHTITAFGWDRVVWGSDYPVCTLTADLGRWVAATHEIIKGASETEKAKLLHQNAERIYRLG